MREYIVIASDTKGGSSQENSAWAASSRVGSSRDYSQRFVLLSSLRISVQESQKGQDLCSAQRSKHSFAKTKSWYKHALLQKVTWISVAFCTVKYQQYCSAPFSLGDPAQARCYFSTTRGRTKANGPYRYHKGRWNSGDREVPDWEASEPKWSFPWIHGLGGAKLIYSEIKVSSSS